MKKPTRIKKSVKERCEKTRLADKFLTMAMTMLFLEWFFNIILKNGDGSTAEHIDAIARAIISSVFGGIVK